MMNTRLFLVVFLCCLPLALARCGNELVGEPVCAGFGTCSDGLCQCQIFRFEQDGTSSAKAADPTCAYSGYEASTYAKSCNIVAVVGVITEFLVSTYVMYRLWKMHRLVFTPKPNLQTLSMSLMVISTLIRTISFFTNTVFHTVDVNVGTTFYYYIPDVIQTAVFNLVTLFLHDLSSARLRIVDPTHKRRLVVLFICTSIHFALALGSAFNILALTLFYWAFFLLYWAFISISILTFGWKLRRHLNSPVRVFSQTPQQQQNEEKESSTNSPKAPSRPISPPLGSSYSNSNNSPEQPPATPQSSNFLTVPGPPAQRLSISNPSSGSDGPQQYQPRSSTQSQTPSHSGSRFSRALSKIIFLSIFCAFYCWAVIGVFAWAAIANKNMSANQFVLWSTLLRLTTTLWSWGICFVFYPHGEKSAEASTNQSTSGKSPETATRELEITKSVKNNFQAV